jgi:hypothetical protein
MPLPIDDREQGRPYNITFNGAQIDRQHIGDINNYYQSVESSQKVPFVVLDIDPANRARTLQKIIETIAINVNIGDNEVGEIPFISPLDFEDWKEDNKLFMFGTGGSGKSRSMIKILEKRLADLKKIYVINPQNAQNGAPKDSTVSDLVKMAKPGSLLVWDNFPLGLDGGHEPQIGMRALGRICSPPVDSLLATLYSGFLEIYRNSLKNIPELSVKEVTYSEEAIENILNTYGKKISAFLNAYGRLSQIEAKEISHILWEKEPTPLTVYHYLEELTRKKWIDGYDTVKLAEELPPSTKYYTQQFALVLDARPEEAEFLYSLKLAHELGLEERTIHFLDGLQNRIFQSNAPKFPSRSLSSWIFQTDTHYTMYDVARNSIDFPDDVKPRIIKYLVSAHFLKKVPKNTRGMTRAGIIYRTGIFVGKNVRFMEYNSLSNVLPDNIHTLIKDEDFGRGMARGLTYIFSSLSKEFQTSVWKLAEQNDEFGFGLAYGFSYNLVSVDQKSRKRLWEFLKKKYRFAEGFSYGLEQNPIIFSHRNNKEIIEQILTLAEKGIGDISDYGDVFLSNFPLLDVECQRRTLKLAEKNEDFSSITEGSLSAAIASSLLDQQIVDQILELAEKGVFGLGVILDNFPSLSQGMKKKIWIRIAERGKYGDFARELGLALGQHFSSLTTEDKQKAWDIARNSVSNDSKQALGFDYGLGCNLGYYFSSLSPENQENAWQLTNINNEFKKGFAIGFGPVFSSLAPEIQDRVWNLVEADVGFALDLASELEFASLSPIYQDKAWELAKKDDNFAVQLAFYIGAGFPSISEEFQTCFLDFCEKNNKFAAKLGDGLDNYSGDLEYMEENGDDAEYSFSLSKEIQERIFGLARSNSDFAVSSGFENKDSRFWKIIRQNLVRRK